jgi:uncharacterized protein (TIGR03083 family)
MDERTTMLEASSETTRLLDPIRTAHLFPSLESKLLDLLRSLAPGDWEKQTVAPKWKVKDVAAHLLDTQLRKLSLCRDGYDAHVPEPLVGVAPGDLTALVNSLNAAGVSMYRRLSPRVLVSLMEVASRENAAYHIGLHPSERACFAVSWAGETESQNWFDTAREFTERWHHQQQIRDAVNRPGIMTRELYFPVLDAFMRALPFHYRGVSRPAGTLAHFQVAGECGGNWYLYRDSDGWQLAAEPVGQTASQTIVPQEIAWKIFTKGISQESAKAQAQVAGDPELGQHLFDMICIVG